MDLVAIVRIAMRALARNKLRSMLTMLGINIGVGAVIALFCVGHVAHPPAQQQIPDLGSIMPFVRSHPAHRGALRICWGSLNTLVSLDRLRTSPQ